MSQNKQLIPTNDLKDTLYAMRQPLFLCDQSDQRAKFILNLSSGAFGHMSLDITAKCFHAKKCKHAQRATFYGRTFGGQSWAVRVHEKTAGVFTAIVYIGQKKSAPLIVRQAKRK